MFRIRALLLQTIKIVVQTTMRVPGGVTVCLLVMVTLSSALDAPTSPVSSQESDTQHSRRLQRLEAEMEILRKLITDVKQDCRSGLQGPQTSMLSRLAGEISELRAQLQEAEMRKELSALRERFSALQADLQTNGSRVEGARANQATEWASPPQPKAAFLGKLPETRDWTTTVPNQAPIRFTEVFDIGDGYDPVTGVYTTRYPGVYVINFQMFPTFSQDIIFDLKMNDIMLVRARAAQGGYTASCSSGISVRAAAGDRFWLETNKEGSYYGFIHSFLSFALVIAEP